MDLEKNSMVIGERILVWGWRDLSFGFSINIELLNVF